MLLYSPQLETSRPSYPRIDAALDAMSIPFDTYDLVGGGRLYRTFVGEQLTPVAGFPRQRTLDTGDNSKVTFTVMSAHEVFLIAQVPESQYVWVHHEKV